VGSSVRASRCVRMPMTGRSFEIASSTRRTLLRRPTSIGMIDPGKSTELRSGRIESCSGTSTGPPPPSAPGGPPFIFVIETLLLGARRRRGLATYAAGSAVSRRYNYYETAFSRRQREKVSRETRALAERERGAEQAARHGADREHPVIGSTHRLPP